MAAFETTLPCYKRSYLFFQGVCSPFFSQLADSLKAYGHVVSKVNFTGGDIAYWGHQPAIAFRASVDQLSNFIDKKFNVLGVTDIVLFGDRRPVHRPVIEQAKNKGIRIHVFEEGYFRPCWVTLERDGVNAHSLLPRDPDWYLQTGRTLRRFRPPELFLSPFQIRALHDVLYHVAGVLNPLLFPGYRTHSPYSAPVMYSGYIKRLAMKHLHQRSDTEIINALVTSKTPFYFLPLQLNSDAQIRDHSDFKDMTAVMEFVMESFARHAPANSRLVIKNHPLDMSLVNHQDSINLLVKRFELSGRVDYLETGDLELLVKHAQGTVTVNSTVGGVSLQYNCPTITLSDPIYNLPGLTFQGGLDLFWKNADPPDAELFHCFKTTVISTTQLNGGFYCTKGIQLAVKNATVRLVADRSALEELL